MTSQPLTPEREALIRKTWKERDRSFYFKNPVMYIPIRRDWNYIYTGPVDRPTPMEEMAIAVRHDIVHQVDGHGYRINDMTFDRVTCEGVELDLRPRL